MNNYYYQQKIPTAPNNTLTRSEVDSNESGVLSDEYSNLEGIMLWNNDEISWDLAHTMKSDLIK
jgi:hypothetical protein